MCTLGGQAEGEGRKPVGKGLSAKLERKVTEDKRQTKNHQNACQNYRFPGPARDPRSGQEAGQGNENLLLTSSWPGHMGRTTGVSNQGEENRPILAPLGTWVSSSIKVGLEEGGANGTKGLSARPIPGGCVSSLGFLQPAELDSNSSSPSY